MFSLFTILVALVTPRKGYIGTCMLLCLKMTRWRSLEQGATSWLDGVEEDIAYLVAYMVDTDLPANSILPKLIHVSRYEGII